MSELLFDRLTLAGWRQFASVDIQFHRRLTVITGANGAGKSTLLNLLTGHLGTSRPYLSVPTKNKGSVEFLTGLFTLSRRLFDWFVRQKDEPQSIVGQLGYTNGVTAQITVPRVSGLTYSPSLNGQQTVLGFHMPSHRLIPSYQSVPSLDFRGVPPEEAFWRMIGENYAYYMGKAAKQGLVDPYACDPEQEFEFFGPMMFHRTGHAAAELTIIALDLNRMDLMERRRDRLSALRDKFEKLELTNDPQAKTVLIEAAKQYEIHAEREYAACARNFLT